MARFFGKIIAIPVRFLAVVFGWIKVFNTEKLWSVVWKLSRDSRDGCTLLSYMCSKRITEEAGKTAEEIIAETKDCVAASLMGQLAIQHKQDLEAARKWIRVANEKGCRNPEMLLMLKLLISAREGCEDENVINEILARNDLSGGFTRTALFCRAWKLAEKKQWSDAEAIADKILGIEEQVDARIIKWMCCLVRGDEGESQAHFRRAQKQMSDGWFKIMAASGWLCMGNEDKAIELLYQAQKEKVVLQESKSPIGALFHSQRYKEFCERRG